MELHLKLYFPMIHRKHENSPWEEGRKEEVWTALQDVWKAKGGWRYAFQESQCAQCTVNTPSRLIRWATRVSEDWIPEVSHPIRSWPGVNTDWQSCSIFISFKCLLVLQWVEANIWKYDVWLSTHIKGENIQNPELCFWLSMFGEYFLIHPCIIL